MSKKILIVVSVLLLVSTLVFGFLYYKSIQKLNEKSEKLVEANKSKTEYMLKLRELETENLKFEIKDDVINTFLKDEDAKKELEKFLIKELHLGIGYGQYPIEDYILVDENNFAGISIAFDNVKIKPIKELASKLNIKLRADELFEIETHGVEISNTIKEDNLITYEFNNVDLTKSPYVLINSKLRDACGRKSRRIIFSKSKLNK